MCLFLSSGDGGGGAYLDDEGLILKTGTHPQLAHVRRFVDEVLDTVENTAAGGRDAAVDAALTDGLPGDAGVSVDVLETEGRRLSTTSTGHQRKEVRAA